MTDHLHVDGDGEEDEDGWLRPWKFHGQSQLQSGRHVWSLRKNNLNHYSIECDLSPMCV